MIIQTAVVRGVLYTVLVLVLDFLSISLFAQKQFNVTLQLPKGIHQEKVEVWVDNGKTDELLNAKPSKEGRIKVTGDYYGLYAAVSLQYPSDPPINASRNTFFVTGTKATVTFHPSSSPAMPFAIYSLKNALDFKAEKTRLDEYVSVERKKAIDYEARYGERIFTGSDTTIRRHYFNAMKDLGRKGLEYVRSHPNSYYCFYFFRSELAKPMFAPSDSLLLIFNTFADRFRFSDEGNYLNQSLRGRLLSENKGGNAIAFEARDISNRKVTLAQFIGKTYVLLHFWATWCTPCMKELPAVKQISSQYESKDLQIISIALKSSEADHRRTISKYGMDWIQIYNDPDLLHKYGDLPIPRICLIDKSGKVVYDQIGVGQNDDFQLNDLREKLKDVMQKLDK